MNLRRVFGAIATSMAACLLVGGAEPRPAPPAPRVPPPGEGVVCVWGIYTVIQSVGSTCFPGENPAYQADVRRMVAQLDAYVARNAKDATPAQLAEFKRTQGHAGTPAALLCQGDAVEMYRAFEKVDRAKAQADLDQLLSRDGPPTWGTCL